MLLYNNLQKKNLKGLLSNILGNLKQHKKGVYYSLVTLNFDDFDIRALNQISNALENPTELFDLSEVHKIMQFIDDRGFIINIQAIDKSGQLMYNYFGQDGIIKDETGISVKLVEATLRENTRFTKIINTSHYIIFESS